MCYILNNNYYSSNISITKSYKENTCWKYIERLFKLMNKKLAKRTLNNFQNIYLPIIIKKYYSNNFILHFKIKYFSKLPL